MFIKKNSLLSRGGAGLALIFSIILVVTLFSSQQDAAAASLRRYLVPYSYVPYFGGYAGMNMYGVNSDGKVCTMSYDKWQRLVVKNNLPANTQNRVVHEAKACGYGNYSEVSGYSSYNSSINAAPSNQSMMVTPTATEMAVSTQTVETTQTVTITVSSNATLGKFLVDSNGRTLYEFAKDSANVSTCTDACAQIWPPLIVQGSLSSDDGLSGGLSLITRTDGSQQVTYDGMPLYYFSGDKKPGDTLGQGYANLWKVVAP